MLVTIQSPVRKFRFVMSYAFLGSVTLMAFSPQNSSVPARPEFSVLLSSRYELYPFSFLDHSSWIDEYYVEIDHTLPRMVYQFLPVLRIQILYRGFLCPFWPLDPGSGTGFFRILDLGSQLIFLIKQFYNSLQIGLILHLFKNKIIFSYLWLQKR